MFEENDSRLPEDCIADSGAADGLELLVAEIPVQEVLIVGTSEEETELSHDIFVRSLIVEGIVQMKVPRQGERRQPIAECEPGERIAFFVAEPLLEDQLARPGRPGHEKSQHILDVSERPARTVDRPSIQHRRKQVSQKTATSR